MDQLKKIAKHWFWICCGVIAIASVAIGVMSTLSAQEEAKKGVARITAAEAKIRPVASVKDHPNEKTKVRHDEITAEMERRVYKLWEENYARQQAVLTWPEELQAGFLEEIKDKKYRQPELIDYAETEIGLLSQPARDRYRNYIAEELPKLADIIKGKWHLDPVSMVGGGGGGPAGGKGGGPGGGPPGGIGGPPGGIGGPPGGGIGGPPGGIGGPGGGEGSMGGMAGAANAQVYDPSEVVAWSAASQQQLVSKVFRGINIPTRSPSTLDILYAQEDLWIVKALLNVIAKTNGDALERHRAPIKEIVTLATGAEAGSKVGGIKMLFAGASAAPAAPGPAAGGTGGTDGNAPAVGKPGAGGGPPGGNPYAGAGGAPAGHPAEDRYVDKKFAPKKRADIKAAIESDSFTDAPAAVAKRVPFRMQLVMDQRELNKFLVNCGNNELMVEVSQVRYNPQASSSSAAYGSGGAPGAPGAPGQGGPGGPPGGIGGVGKGGPGGMGAPGGGEGMSGGMSGTTGTSVAISPPVGLSPYDVLVDIFGYVQIYNEPSLKKFKQLEAAMNAGNTAGAASNSATATSAAATPAENSAAENTAGQNPTDASAVSGANPANPTPTTPDPANPDPAASAPAGETPAAPTTPEPSGAPGEPAAAPNGAATPPTNGSPQNP